MLYTAIALNTLIITLRFLMLSSYSMKYKLSIKKKNHDDLLISINYILFQVLL